MFFLFFFFFNVLTFLKFNFNWRIIALWCGVGFYFTTTWISYMYTYIPSLLSLPPTPSYLTPLGHHRWVLPSFFFFFNYFLLGYSCFTLCWFLLYNIMNQPCVYIYLLSCDPPYHLPIPPVSVITEHRAEQPVLYNSLRCLHHKEKRKENRGDEAREKEELSLLNSLRKTVKRFEASRYSGIHEPEQAWTKRKIWLIT